MGYFSASRGGDKIFRGAYMYSRNDQVYCEEEFEVFKESREMIYTFVSEQISRVSTGELLTITTVYKVNKSFLPIDVLIQRSLGTFKVSESFIYDRQATRVEYTFTNGTRVTKEILRTGPSFTIAAPPACTSMLCLRSKKFDNTAKNFYSLVTSKNMWEYDNIPTTKNIVVQKITPVAENLKLGDTNHQAILYKLYEDTTQEEQEKEKKKQKKIFTEDPDDIKVWLSQHLTIPYLIKDEKSGTRIEIKYLTNLDND